MMAKMNKIHSYFNYAFHWNLIFVHTYANKVPLKILILAHQTNRYAYIGQMCIIIIRVHKLICPVCWHHTSTTDMCMY